MAVWGSGPKIRSAHLQGRSATWTFKGHCKRPFILFYFLHSTNKFSYHFTGGHREVEYIYFAKYFHNHTSTSIALRQLQRVPQCVHAYIAYAFRHIISFGESNQNIFCLSGNDGHGSSLWSYGVSPHMVPLIRSYSASKIKVLHLSACESQSSLAFTEVS